MNLGGIAAHLRSVPQCWRRGAFGMPSNPPL
ncbi:hypothetical protein B0G75_12153 [Paraburkholderia sp. BL18I3N2]|nr:hypothetical protein B0G75_12153 [Paraburkholderia sp. BL18I3N2]